MMRMIGEAAVAVSSSLPLTIVLNVTLIALGALIAACIAQRHRASVRHALFATAFIVLLALPIASVVIPARSVRISMSSPSATLRVAGVIPPVAAGPLSQPGRLGEVQGIAPAPERMSIAMILWLGWILGATLCLVPMITGLARVRYLCRTGLPWREGQDFVTEIAANVGIRKRIQLLVHEAIVGPMTCGVVRPAVVLPRDAREWTREDLRRAIVHELEHIRRADWSMLCLARVVCALYWFHPLVWMCWHRLRLEAERACDDAVLLDAPSDAYADQLVTLAERLASPTRQSMLAMANRGDLSARVSAVLDDRQPRGRAGVVTIATAAVCAIVLLTAVAPLRAVPRPQVRSNPDGNRLTFEVASIKRNPADGGRRSVGDSGGRFVMINYAIGMLIRSAYPDAVEYIGGPDWIGSEPYDVTAVAPGGTPRADIPPLLRALLADRFNFKAHYEMREQPTYDLVLARGDTQVPRGLKKVDVDCDARRAARDRGETLPAAARLSNGMLPCTDGGTYSDAVTIRAGGTSMARFAEILRSVAGRAVFDRTGLKDYYEFQVTFHPNPQPSTDTPSLFTALQEQLGLQLESSRRPVRVLVIDHIERPSEN
jgi:uncharacterized protein (TIGR03435 family)